MKDFLDTLTIKKYKFFITDDKLDEFKSMLCMAKLSNCRKKRVSMIKIQIDNLKPFKTADWMITINLSNNEFCALLIECSDKKYKLYNYFRNHTKLVYTVEKES